VDFTAIFANSERHPGRSSCHIDSCNRLRGCNSAPHVRKSPQSCSRDDKWGLRDSRHQRKCTRPRWRTAVSCPCCLLLEALISP